MTPARLRQIREATEVTDQFDDDPKYTRAPSELHRSQLLDYVDFLLADRARGHEREQAIMLQKSELVAELREAKK